MKLTPRQLTITGVLAAMAILLDISGIGRIPWFAGIRATIMHIPAILGGILEGPIVGGIVGFIFGLFSFSRPSAPFFTDPLVSIFPRIFIGITSCYAYRAIKGEHLPIVVGAIVGTVTNTALVLGMIGIKGYLPWRAIGLVALVNGIPEIIVAIIIVFLVVKALRRAGLR